MPPEMRMRATLRSAEFGFLGVVVYTRVHTPRRCGAATFFLRPLPDFRPGVASFLVLGVRPLRTSWEVVGMRTGQDSSGPRGSCRRRRRSAAPHGRDGVRGDSAAAAPGRARGRRANPARGSAMTRRTTTAVAALCALAFAACGGDGSGGGSSGSAEQGDGQTKGAKVVDPASMDGA